MNNKEKLEILIKSIKEANPKLRTEDISVRAGYKEQTLTQAISSGNVSNRMYNTVANEFSRKSELGKEKPVIIEDTYGASLEALIRIESKIDTNLSYVAEIYAHLKEVPATKIFTGPG